MDRCSSFPANGHISPTRRWIIGAHAGRTTPGEPRAPRQDARRGQNERWLPRIRQAAASNRCDRHRKTPRLLRLPPRPRFAHGRNIEQYYAPASEGRQSERKTRPRRRLPEQTSATLLFARDSGPQPYTLTRIASLQCCTALLSSSPISNGSKAIQTLFAHRKSPRT